MTRLDLGYYGIAALGRAYRRRDLSPVEVTRALLDRLTSWNTRHNAFLRLLPDSALAQAAAAETEIAAGHWRGPLHGVPISIKDLFYTRGIPTTAGSRIFENFVPTYDATVVTRLEAAGAVILGKNHLHELAYGVTNENPHFGPCRNPWDPQRVPGGSSGGSAAAVAAGLSFASYGTDTGGSIRIPASYCGVTGLKPTYGRISRHGVFPLSTNLDHVGPFARSVYDAALAAEAVAGPDPADPSSLPTPCPHWSDALGDRIPLAGTRLGIPRPSLLAPLCPEVAAGAAQAAREFTTLGAEIEEIDLPDFHEIGEVAHLLQMADGAAVHHRILATRPGDYSEDVRHLLEQGHLVSAVDYLNAQRLRRVFQQRLHALFDTCRAILLPATPVAAPLIGAPGVDYPDAPSESVGGASTRLVRPFNFAGVPVLTIPCGLTGGGLPFGLQIVTRAGDERSGLLLGHAFQQHTAWHTLRPSRS